MDLYSKTKPDLISSKTLYNINKLFEHTGKPQPTWTNSLKEIYNSYIKPNVLILSFIFIVIIFFVVQYFIVKNKKMKQKKILDDYLTRQNIMMDEQNQEQEHEQYNNEYENFINHDLEYIDNITFNEDDDEYVINKQYEDIRYMDDEQNKMFSYYEKMERLKSGEI